MKYDFVKLTDLEMTLSLLTIGIQPITLTTEQVKHICDRHFGVGADGVILVRKSPRSECGGIHALYQL